MAAVQADDDARQVEMNHDRRSSCLLCTYYSIVSLNQCASQ
jgi:hypothetical protein